MSDNSSDEQADYDKAVIKLLQEYGLCCEEFGRASKGSPRGMEVMMRFAKEAADDVLWAALGRKPTLEELSQLPPLYERPIVNLSLGQLSAAAPKKRRKKRKE